MDSVENFFCGLLFKLKIYETEGYAFQTLFNNIMTSAFPNFQPIVPWGSAGDGGNDGYIPSEGKYYQVYGPSIARNNESVVNYAQRKLRDDFFHLKDKWGECSTNAPLEHFYFVYNDFFKGIPAPLEEAMLNLKEEAALTEGRVLGTFELKNIFFTLPDHNQIEIVGYLPPTSEIPQYVKAKPIGDLLEYMLKRIDFTSLVFSSATDAPDVAKKAKYNELSQPIKDYLVRCLRFNSYIDNFAQSSQDQDILQAISDFVHKLYLRSKEIVPDDAEDASDLRFVWIVNQTIPPAIRENHHARTSYQVAALVILSYYFKSCDIYENPPEEKNENVEQLS